MTPSPISYHQWISKNLVYENRTFQSFCFFVGRLTFCQNNNPGLSAKKRTYKTTALYNIQIRPRSFNNLKIAHAYQKKELVLMKGIAEMDTVLLEKKCYTYEDYAKLPEGAMYQLIGGQLIMTPAPLIYHQEISKHLEYLLYEHVELKQKLGKFTMPRLMYILKTRRPISRTSFLFQTIGLV